MVPIQLRWYLNLLEVFGKIFSAKQVENNPATELTALCSQNHKEPEGEEEEKPEAVWPWCGCAAQLGHFRSAASHYGPR